MESPIIEMIPLHKLVKCHIGRGSFVSNLSQMNVPTTIIENITHPTTPKSITQSVYDKTSLVGKAELLIEAISITNTSDVYCV
ncbi:MAG: hypothetical protein JKX84_08545 [Flavobacteriales bacterium]|nr:hypothetical protein [Flavobacteriales bacterium]